MQQQFDEPIAALVGESEGQQATAEDLVATAVARARRLAETPPDTFRLTKTQLQSTFRERLARLRPAFDPQVLDLWLRGVKDGRIERYMTAVVSRR